MRPASTTVSLLFAVTLPCTGAASLCAQQIQAMRGEHAFFYLMRVYHLTPSTRTFEYPGEIERLGSTFLQYYVTMFDSATFRARRSDEFQRNAYAATMTRRLIDSTAAVRFDSRYAVTLPASRRSAATPTLGEYSFADSSFPIRLDLRGALPLLFLERLEVYGEIDNWLDFGFRSPTDVGAALSLPMREAEARTFLTRRRAPDGSVDRTVSLTLTYSILDRASTTQGSMGRSFGVGGLGRNLRIYVHSIDIHDPLTGRRLLAIHPDTAALAASRRMVAAADSVMAIAERARIQQSISGRWRGDFIGHETVNVVFVVDHDSITGALQSSAGISVVYRGEIVLDERLRQWKEWNLLDRNARAALVLTPGSRTGANGYDYQYKNPIISVLSGDEDTLVASIPIPTSYTLHVTLSRDRSAPLAKPAVPTPPTAPIPAPTDSASDLPLADIEAWISREGPQIGWASDYVLTRGQAQVSLRYRIESASLTECRLTIRSTVDEDTSISTVTLRDVNIAELRPRVYDVPAGAMANRPSYFVPLLALRASGRPFGEESRGAGQSARQGPANLIYVRVRDGDMAAQLASRLRRAAILCGAPRGSPN